MIARKAIWAMLMASISVPAFAADAGEGAAAAEEGATPTIIVKGARERSMAGTKTDTPLTQTPQALTVVTADEFISQGAISISDTLNYVAGVTANPYGPDSRVDGSLIRGLNPLQFRDGMRDLFSYYASIRSDPYNFSQIEVVRGPASVLFGAGTLGGLINMVSKTPEFETRGEASLVYGSFDRKEAMGDITGPITEQLAARIVARVRDGNTQVDHVPDDRVMVAPSLTWQPGVDTRLTLTGLYQEDDQGSTSQFLPLVGTLLPNPNGKLPNNTFIGKPGWDRYDGRLLEGGAQFEHRFNEHVKVNLKARYIDSDLTYLTHYPDSYSNPANPYLDPAQRTIGLYADGSYARLNVFTTDNHLRFDFNTGAQIEHLVIAGIDYSWNRVRKTGGYGYEFIDIYNIDYAALSDYGGGLPTPTFSEDTKQRQVGFYVQDQIRVWDKVSVVLGGRRDYVRTKPAGGTADKDHATSFRAGIIADVLPGVSPYFSYTEAFDPISGRASDGSPFKPKQGRQYEGGVKFHPDDATLITLTAYHIKESNRPVSDDRTPDPFDQIQLGSLTSKGYEIEAKRTLAGNYDIVANFSHNKARADGTNFQLDNVPRDNASVFATKTVKIGEDASVRFGGGVRYVSSNVSGGVIKTPDYTLVDGLVDVDWKDWSLTVTATNLFNKKFYAACLARGDCFIGAERNIMARITRRF
jgi:iron complex outermembrane recepter protein